MLRIYTDLTPQNINIYTSYFKSINQKAFIEHEYYLGFINQETQCK